MMGNTATPAVNKDGQLRIEDGSVRRQLSKACKKIFKLFRGQLDTSDPNAEFDEDFSCIGMRTSSPFVFSEV